MHFQIESRLNDPRTSVQGAAMQDIPLLMAMIGIQPGVRSQLLAVRHQKDDILGPVLLF